MKFNIHAGHNPEGKTGCGAVGLLKESTENRKVKNEVIRLLKQEGHTVNDCTVDNGINQNDILKKIVEKCNKNTVDWDISIHFNSGAKDSTGNGKSTGTEVLVYGNNQEKNTMASNICKRIEGLGFKNRGVKINNNLYFLKNTKNKALLIECCFVDDADDIALYNYKTMAKAIVEGLLSKTIKDIDKGLTGASTGSEVYYRVCVGAYKEKSNALKKIEELKSKGIEAFIAVYNK